MRFGKYLPLAAASLWLVGCGGGGGGSPATMVGPAGSNQVNGVAVGRISAFGSVFVNGVEFETQQGELRRARRERGE